MAASSAIQALYLHIPFCVQRCRYCDFPTRATVRTDAGIAAYMQGLAERVEELAASGLLGSVQTAYIGGGTPSINCTALAQLAAAVKRSCPGLQEFSCEANPESLTAAGIDLLQHAGVSRISLGVQSLDDQELRRLGRIHSAGQALACARAVLAAGLDLSCDLMCGIPLQTPSSFSRSLEGILDTGLAHVSVYPLMVEEGTPLCRDCEQGLESYPNDDVQADLMQQAQQMLEEHGFARYEVASYARPGHECAHNIAYWTGKPYLGLGTSAASMMDPSTFAQVERSTAIRLVDPSAPAGTDADKEAQPAPEAARQPLEAAQLPADTARLRFTLTGAPEAYARPCTTQQLRADYECLNLREALAEDLMLGLRMSRGIGADLIASARRAGMGLELDQACHRSVEQGLARRTATGGLAPTTQGWLLGNQLYGIFWDLASPPEEA